MEKTFSISTAGSRTSKSWKNECFTWEQIIKRLQNTKRTGESCAEYRNMPKAQQDKIKDVGGFVGGRLKGSRRVAAAIENRCLVTLDADFADEGLWDTLELTADFACLVYSTHKHTPEKPRLRVIIPLARPVTPEEYGAVSRRLAEDIGMDYFDDTTYQPHRLMYWPSTPADGEYIFRVLPGPFLNPDAVLARYDDWRDVSQWPVSSRVGERIRAQAGREQADPLTKKGMIGAFCRAYSIEEAIEAFLPEVYAPCDIPGRYTYREGSTTGGLVVYEGKFAYSHHATDPCCAQLLNAFDLVRLHRFGDQDAEAAPGTPAAKLPSFLAMTALAAEDKGVKRKLAQERNTAAKQDFENLGEDWQLRLSTNRRGVVENTIDNAVLIILHDPNLEGAIARNTFKDRIVALRDLPWRKIRDRRNGDIWDDADDAALRHYMEKVYGITAASKVYDAVSVAAAKRQFHPVRRYLEALTWDGQERIAHALSRYLGAEDTPYIRAVSRKIFIGAVARVMQPGCKFDYMPVLAGRQGLGKSSFVADIAGPWYSDTLTCVSGKEAYEQIQGYWIVEMGELSALKKTDIEPIKNFLSKQVDSYRAAYGRRVEDHPRQCVFIGTTNAATFLRDDTGNRRFWPVAVTRQYRKGSLGEEERNQLFAEAMAYYQKGEALYLPRELENQAAEQQELYEEDDPNVGKILDFLERLYPEEWDEMSLYDRRSWLAEDYGKNQGTRRKDRVCVAEIWQECYNGDPKQLDRRKISELHAAMRKIRGWELAKGKLKNPPYGVQRCYIRVADRK